jgi:hypothetical protein
MDLERTIEHVLSASKKKRLGADTGNGMQSLQVPRSPPAGSITAAADHGQAAPATVGHLPDQV